jgi:(R,R)-butanediol dehydrogenase/meso-butanediol dehydrogenase/diacetyl reductase
MKAARYDGQEDIRVEDVPEPKSTKPDEIRIRPTWCGIGGTDLHHYKAGPIVIPTKRHSLTVAKVPQILGHEFSALVVERLQAAD